MAGLNFPVRADTGSFDQAMERARNTTSTATRFITQTFVRMNQELLASGATLATGMAGQFLRMQAQSAATSVAMRLAWVAAAVGIVEAIGGVISSVREQLNQVIELGSKATERGVSPEFFQQFIAGSREARVSVESLEDALKHAHEASKERLAPDWTVWDDGKRKIGEVEKALMDLREMFTTDQRFTGLDLFRNATDTEHRTRAVLVAMTELEVIGQNLAALDLGEKMFGAQFADNIRQGNNSAREMLATMDRLADDRTGLWSSKLVEDAKETDRQLKAAKDTLERELNPQWESAVAAANGLKQLWADIVGLLGQAAAVFNRLPSWYGMKVPSGAGLGEQAGLNDIGGGGNGNPLGVAGGTRDVGTPTDRFGNVPLPRRRPSDAPKPKQEKEEAETQDAFEAATDAINRQVAALTADAAAVGQSQAAHQQLRVELRLIEAARQSGVEITDKQIEDYARLRGEMGAEQALAATGIALTREQAAEFGKLSDRVRTVAEMLESKKRAFQGVNDAVRFAGNEIVEVIDRATQKGAKFGDIMRDVLRNVTRQMLQAAITGEGAFAKLFGVSSSTGGVGGLAGLLAGLLRSGAGSGAITASVAGPTGFAIGGAAYGGTVEPGALAYVGEHGPNPKLIQNIGDKPIMVTPDDVMRGGGGSSAPVIHNVIDARGADPASIGRLERAVQTLNRTQVSQARSLASAQRFAQTGVG